MSTNKLIESLLDNDPVDNVEKILGKSFSQFDKNEQGFLLQKALVYGKQKKEYLKSIGDTYFCMGWNEFIQLIQKYGFKEGLKYEYSPKHEFEDCTKIEEAVIYYRPDGLIIWATSFSNKTSLSYGKLYGFIETEKIKDDPEYYDILSHCSRDSLCYYDKETRETLVRKYVYFDYDAREALIYKINMIQSKTNFVSPWPKRPFLWLLDYNDEQIPNYDYYDINNKKISMCCPEVQYIILGENNNKEESNS